MILVIGVLKDKDMAGIIDPLARLADRVIATQPRYARAADVATLAGAVRRVHHRVTEAWTVEDAVATAQREAGEDDLIVITGSLFTVGDARAVLAGGQAAGPLRGLKG
jgi:dihydrofolate synthase/folylpolyglutamate synthase